MQTIKIKAPAKINLTLEVLDKRSDGFHNIKSIMQAIDLYDYLTISVSDSDNTDSGTVIELSGNSDEIPYDNRNLVYKAVEKFLEKTNIKNKIISIYIEKNIPIEAGLAGGSADAAGTFYGLNKLFNNSLSKVELEDLCASLGSDLNFCLHGGTALCTSRGEIIEKLPTPKLELSLIKPKNLGISAKEAYTKFSMLPDKTVPNNSEKLIEKLNNDGFDSGLLYNSLEIAVIDDYLQLQEIKNIFPESLMSGSGPTFFVLQPVLNSNIDSEKFLIIENLISIGSGVSVC